MKKGIFTPTVAVLSIVVLLSVGFLAVKTTKKSYETKIDEKSNFINNLSYNLKVEMLNKELFLDSKLNETFYEFCETSNFRKRDFFHGYPIWEFGFSERNPENYIEGRFANLFQTKTRGSTNIEDSILHVRFFENRELSSRDRSLTIKYKFSPEYVFNLSEFFNSYKSVVSDAKDCYATDDIEFCLKDRGFEIEKEKNFLKVKKPTKYGKIKFAIKLQ